METASNNSLPSLPSAPKHALPATFRPLDARTNALACRRPEDALEQPTIHALIRHFGSQYPAHAAEQVVLTEIAVIVEHGMEGFSAARKMTAAQVALFAEKIAEQFPHESLADINVFMRGAACGDYDGGEFYATVDIPRIMKWWKVYLEQKAEARERVEHEQRSARQREAEANIAAIPGLSEAVNKAVADNKERLHEEARRRRMARLAGTFKIMTDQDLRDAYVKYKDGDTRSVILQEAAGRGLLDKSMNEAIKRGEEEARAEAENLTSHPEELPAIPEDQSLLTK